MKRILLFLSALFIATTAIAHTINWYVDGNIFHTTTCESGENVTPPTAPEKYGYTFKRWKKNYTRIEYLKSTGMQYINTHMQLNSDSTVEVGGIFHCGASVLGEDGTGFGTYSGFLLFIACTSGASVWGGKAISSLEEQLGINSENVFNLKINKYGIYVDDIRKIYFNPPSEVVSSQKNFLLFATTGSYGWSQNSLHYVKIYDNNILVRDFIPVLDIEGEPCLYDLIEHKFYYNAGTGRFITGPIIDE